MSCAINDCAKPVHKRGWCHMHWRRWTRHGNPLTTLKKGVQPRPVLDRMIDHIVVTRVGCWEWQGATTTATGGYGSVQQGNGLGSAVVHRLMWELLVGLLPAEIQLDHLCRNRICCNPDHLEPVTPAENVNRGARRKGWSEVARTRCKNGHAYTADTPRDWMGYRRCSECRREQYRRNQEVRHGAA